MSDPTLEDFDPFAGPAIAATAPTTAPQREIWTASVLGEETSLAYNESVTLVCRGLLDVEALKAAFADVLARHEALRATITEDGLTLLINEPFVPKIEVIDLSGLSIPEQASKLAGLKEKAVLEPFSWTRGPLFRAVIVRQGAELHQVLLTAHHVVCDGWSTAVILKDWAAYYNARSKGFGATLPDPNRFSAFALAQAARTPAEQNADEAYWLSQFQGAIPVLELPTERRRPPQRGYASLREDLVLGEPLVSALRKAGAKSRASLFATLLAGFNVLLHRLSGAEDLVVGMPSAGQAAADQPTLVGHCVNMLPIRTSMSGDEPFSAVLGRVRSCLLDAQEHQDFTFGALLAKLPIARDPSRTPLVSVVFNVDRGLSGEAIGFDDLHVELITNPRRFENFELFLNAVELNGQVTLECQYNTGLFSANTIRRWLKGYRELLTSVAEDPQQKVGALRILTEDEGAKLALWNQTSETYPRDRCVHEWVQAQALRTPNAIAIDCGDQTLSYGELEARANQLARRLRELGVQNGGLVGLCLERTPELFVGLLGIHKAGAGYVPLDPDYPADRLRFMVEDAELKVLLTSAKLALELPLPAEAVVCVDAERAELAKLDNTALAKDERSANPESVAYVIYTSGSTGLPKGVLVPQRALANLVHSVSVRPGLSERDVVLGITTLSFDIAVSETWVPLSVGAKIALVTRETAADGASLCKVLEEKRVTFIDATPATYRLLLSAGWLGSLRVVAICTGEAMPKDLAEQVLPMVKELWNGYGPTETTVWSTFWRVPVGFGRILIGQPVANTQIHVQDAQGGLVPPGVVGELFIGGEGVALGYLKRPELTRERFVPDPYVPGAMMYKTGDLGRYLEDGTLECLGRNDHQIKLRGFRIELGEIEDALRQHPSVAEAAVILREDSPGDARIIGYFTPQGTEPDAASLRQHLKRTLPDYMIPFGFMPLDIMPLTPSGKINRKALPKPSALVQAEHTEFVAPRTDTERMLAERWAEALRVGRVSVEDDFFALGGHSLLAAQIMGKLRRDQQIELSFRTFFEAPTIAQLAARIDRGRERPSPMPSRKPLLPRDPALPIPLSVTQERLYLLEEMHPAQRIVHNLPAAWRFEGDVNLELLQRSLDTISARHETLRTTLGVVANQPVQRIQPQVSLPITEEDLTSIPSEGRHARMMERIRELSAIPFDLEEGPLFLSVLFRFGAEISVYFTLRHNFIWDGWSFDVFVNELSQAYSAFARGVQPTLPELPISYADYTFWHRDWLKSPQLQDQIQWWQGQLANAPADLDLPLDHPRPVQATYAGGNLTADISREQADTLTRLGRDAGTTLFNVLFAAYATLLLRYSGQREILVGTPVRARVMPEVEPLIGPFINAVVLRTLVDPEASFLEHLKRVRDVTLDAFSHEEMPLELLGIRPPIVRAFFSFQDARSRAVTLGDAQIQQVEVEPPAAANDLMVWIMERPHGLKVVANFSTEIFEPETIAQLLRSYSALLSDIISDPKQRLTDLAIQAERVVDSSSFVGSSVVVQPQPVATAAVAHELVLAFANASAEPALVQGQNSYSGIELVRRARGIASSLSRCDLPPNSTVALRLPRSLELWAAVLAAWQLGHAPLVLSPRLATERAKRMLVAAEARVLLTQREGAEGFEGTPSQVILLDTIDQDSELPTLPTLGDELVAWVDVSFDGEGCPVVSRTSHRSLVARAMGIAGVVKASHGKSLAVVAAPGSESLPLELLLGPVLGVTTRFAKEGVHAEDALAESTRGAADFVALGPSEAWSVWLSQRAKVKASIVYDGASPAFYTELLRASEKVVGLRSLTTHDFGLFVQEIKAPFDADLLGQSVEGVGVEVVDGKNLLLPCGAVGRVRVTVPGRAEHTLSYVARRTRETVRLLGSAGLMPLLQGGRFSLLEATRQLEQHASIRRAFVRADEAEPGLWRLVTYFQPNPGAVFTETELRAHLRAVLPEALVPQAFVEVAELPLLLDGSVDSARLVTPFRQGGAQFVEPKTANEVLLAELFRKALNLQRVGLNDKFFDLGGHSLLCFQVLNELERRSGYRMSPRVLLLNTLAQASVELDRHTGTGAISPEVLESRSASFAPEEKRGIRDRMLGKLAGFLRR